MSLASQSDTEEHLCIRADSTSGGCIDFLWGGGGGGVSVGGSPLPVFCDCPASGSDVRLRGKTGP